MLYMLVAIGTADSRNLDRGVGIQIRLIIRLIRLTSRRPARAAQWIHHARQLRCLSRRLSLRLASRRRRHSSGSGVRISGSARGSGLALHAVSSLRLGRVARLR